MTAVCPACKYSRQGLADDAPCPECGTDPARPVPPLADEPIGHRRRLARGARLACFAIGARIVHAAALLLAALLAADAFHGVLVAGLMALAGLNTYAGLLITRRGQLAGRWRGRTGLRAILAAEFIAVFVGGAAVLVSPEPWLEITLVSALAAGFVARSVLMAGIVNLLARRLRSDRLQAQLRGWLKYAGIAAMTPIVAVIAAALTALIPILAPITIIAAVPYLVFVGVLLVIALVGSALLHARLASELGQAA